MSIERMASEIPGGCSIHRAMYENSSWATPFTRFICSTRPANKRILVHTKVERLLFKTDSIELHPAGPFPCRGESCLKKLLLELNISKSVTFRSFCARNSTRDSAVHYKVLFNKRNNKIDTTKFARAYLHLSFYFLYVNGVIA